MKTTWEAERHLPVLHRGPRRIWTSAAVLSAALALAGAGLAPAAAGGDDVVRRGSCSGAAHWKLKAKADDGRIEVEAELDSNRNRQTWHWRIRHNGHASAHGTRATHAPSGSFEVSRKVSNARGADQIGWRARNPASGQVCHGSLRF